MLECVTYRYSPHSSSDDWKKYRTKEEVEEWKKRDPITLFKNQLYSMSILTQEIEKKLAEEVQSEIAAATKSTENISPPPEESLITDVFANIPRSLKDEAIDFGGN